MFFELEEKEVFVNDEYSIVIVEPTTLQETQARNFLATNELKDDMITHMTYVCALCLKSVRRYDKDKKIIEEKEYSEVVSVNDIEERLKMKVNMWNKVFEAYVEMISPSEKTLKK